MLRPMRTPDPNSTTATPLSGTLPCPDCGGTVSLRATACVHCGRPMEDMAALARSAHEGTLRSEPPIASAASDERTGGHSGARPVAAPPGPGALPPPAPETRLAPPGSHSARSGGGSGRPGSTSATVRSAAKLPAGVGRGAAKTTRAVSGSVLRNPVAAGALGAGLFALFLSYAAYDRGSTVRGMVVTAAVIVLTWTLGSVAKRRAKRAEIRRPWIVPVSRVLALGSAVLLGLAGYGYVRGYLPDVTLPPLPDLPN